MIVDLTALEPNKVSKDLKDYSMMITAPTGYGKTPWLYEVFGDKALFLSFEKSSKGIAGIHSVDVPSYEVLNAYIMQLQRPEVRAKYDVVVLDTLFLFDQSIEQSITNSYGKELLSDCLQYNKAYKIVDKRCLEAIKKIQKMDYTMVYVCHPVEKKVKLADGSEITKIEPKVSDRIKDLILPEIDVRLFCHFDSEGKKVIYTSGTPYFDARVRVGDMDSVVPFDAEAFKKAFAEGIERRVAKENLVDKLESKNPVADNSRDFKVVMDEIVALGTEFAGMGMVDKANAIIFKELGLDNDGKQRTLSDCNESMISTLEVIIQNLKALKAQQ